MITWIRRSIRAFAAPEHRLSCPPRIWERLRLELARRGEGRRESGAFLLGVEASGRREIRDFVPYDDLDPRCLDTGIITFSGACYGKLWGVCRERGLDVVADVHTHPGGPGQSWADRAHPMIGEPGHVSIVVPDYARRPVRPNELGLYCYRQGDEWEDWSAAGTRRFYVGAWA